ncbi:MAG: hypothetical protein IPP94_12605 [Ignavibacteria bacterium]|nr:hypothetical protein [Ignavibacteria bacterium]
MNITNNTVTGCAYPTATSGIFYGLYNSCSAFTLNLSGNSVTNNSVGSATATATGAMYLFYPTGSLTTAGSVHNIFNNTIRGNTRTQSTPGSATQYLFYGSGGAATTNVYGNEIVNNTMPSTGSTYGLYMSAASTVRNVYQNRIDSLSTGGGSVYGMYLTSGTNVNVHRNRILNITATAAAATLYGLYVDGTTVNVWNNMIADLKTPTTTNIPGLYGLYVSAPTTARVYYNSIALNASSSGASFGSTGLYASTAPTLDLRNNIVVNTSANAGVNGRTVAYQRSSTTNATYADSSNANCFHAGTPSSKNFIFYNATDSIQTMAQYRAYMGPNRDALSISETPLVSDAVDRICPPRPQRRKRVTTVAAGADFDADIRQETGYAGSGTAPDIGADEGNFTYTDILPPAIVYASLGNAAPASTRAFNNVTVTDANGVNGTSGTRPRAYYKKGFLFNEWNDNTSATQGWKWVEASGGSSPFSFTIDHTKLPGGSVAAGDTVFYFVVAQDGWTTPNVSINAAARRPPAWRCHPRVPVTNSGSTKSPHHRRNVLVGSGQTYTLTSAISTSTATCARRHTNRDPPNPPESARRILHPDPLPRQVTPPLSDRRPNPAGPNA